MSISYEEYMAKQSPEFNHRVKAKAEELSLNMNLAKVRELLNKTQQEIAEAMGVQQPTVASLESSRDLKLSSLKRYAEAAGGKVRISVEMANGEGYVFTL